MPSLIPGYSYDIFISYRQKDNKYDGWVTDFVDHLKKELEATFKEEISVYFDINPHDGLLETHEVDESLKEKLKCLVFIPIISRTYCDPKSFAWEHEFKSFVGMASADQFGLKIKLPTGNVASRVLPIRIYELDVSDIKLYESVLGGVLRGVEFIFKSPGVNRPLLSREENPQENLNHTNYRDQINKVSNAVKEIIYCLVSEPDKQVKLQEPQTIEQQVIKGTESNIKPDKKKRKSFTEYFPERIPFIKRIIKPVILLIFLLMLTIIIGLFILLKSDKVNSGLTTTYSNIPVESKLMDGIGQYPRFTISPDGRMIAYTTAEGIQLRTLSDFSTKILEGTENVTVIAFSPDGQFLTFVKSGRLYKIGISGSPLSVVHPLGGNFLYCGTDGNIYFSRGLGTEGIWRVSSNGGEPERLTYIIDTLGENAHVWPQLLTDSRTLLFTSLGPSGGSIDSKIVIQRLDSKERKVLADRAIFGRYLSNGNILYANNEGNIFIIPFSLHKSKVSGEARAVLSGVNTSTWSGAAFLSVSNNGNLIYLPRLSNPLNVIEVVDRSGKMFPEDSIPLKTFEMMGHGWSDLRISPSGRFLALIGRTFGSTDIWLLNLDTKNPERITFEPSEDEYPVWSPDGKFLAYTASGTGKYKILIQDLSIRGNPKYILTWPRHGHLSDWSDDGNWFAFYDFSSDKGYDLYIISVNSGEIIPVAITQANELNGQFSPDSRWLTYTSDQSGSTETYIVSVPKLENKRQFLSGEQTGLRWDRGGNKIYFRSGNKIIAQDVEMGNEVIKGKSEVLFQTQSGDFSVSPDGKKFYFTKANMKRPNPPLYLITNWFHELKTKTWK